MKRKLRKPVAFVLLLLLLLTAFLPKNRGTVGLRADRISERTHYLCNGIGVRVTGTEQERQTADWIEDSLRQCGFADENHLMRSSFAGAGELYSENIIAVCNPETDGPLISVVAHYDSVASSAGARDNAASVAALLEIAEYLGQENKNYPCQIRMVFLGSEENGYHGSAAYVTSLTEEERCRHIAAFNMDISAASADDHAVLVCNTLGKATGGGYEEGNFIYPAEGTVVEAVKTSYRTLYGRELGGVFHFGESDHVSFHNAGLEAVNVCWRRVENAMPVLPDSYHKPEDRPEELDYATITASAECILGAIRVLVR